MLSPGHSTRLRRKLRGVRVHGGESGFSSPAAKAAAGLLLWAASGFSSPAAKAAAGLLLWAASGFSSPAAKAAAGLLLWAASGFSSPAAKAAAGLLLWAARLLIHSHLKRTGTGRRTATAVNRAAPLFFA